jgi:hypothetical protein
MLPIFLLSTTIGVTMTSLYCNGKLSKTGINIKACCNKVNQGGCCKTEIKLVKVKDDFLKTSASFKLNKVFNLFYSSAYISYHAALKPVSHLRYISDKSPPIKRAPFYILFQSLII